MKVLIIGSGGREHALAWRLKRGSSVREIIASPGNPGIAEVARCFPSLRSNDQFLRLAEAEGVDLTIVGPEAPLVGGIVDQFRLADLPIIGPTQAAALLEGSKIFAKQFFQRAGIPTARSVQTSSTAEALDHIKRFAFPMVLKADGLAAGKGVIIAQDSDEAQAAIEQLGPRLVIEEYLEGEEASFIALADGKHFVSLPPSQDHKRIFDGERGPNTGGMGASCDDRILTAEQTGVILDRIVEPAIAQMNEEGAPFTGFLYAGLMMTSDGPKVLEFNVRLGDPETQAILHGLDADLGELLRSAAEGTLQPQSVLSRGPSACVVVAAESYPAKPRVGDPITGIAEAEALGATVFHAGTAMSAENRLITAGGRVLGITAGGVTLNSAVENAYRAVAEINFAGMQYRTDIGQKGLKRW